MKARSLTAVFVVVFGLVMACESPNEKPAQEMLGKAKTQLDRGEDRDALLTAFKVSEQYPKTNAAEEAGRLAEALSTKIKNESEAREARRKRISARIETSNTVLATLKARVDDMKQLTWYGDKASDKLVLGKWVKFYFGISRVSGSPVLLPLRLKVQFEGSNWIFARTLSIKAGGKVHQLVPDDWHRNNYGGKVWESVDVPVSTMNPELMAALASSTEVKVRFEGRDSYSDFVIPRGQLDAAKRVYSVWKSINEAGDQT